jgi:hypothetical protein
LELFIMLNLVVVAVVLIFGAASLFGQQKSKTTASKSALVSVPFIGCQSDGQTGPQPAPTGKARALRLPAAAAARLAYYSSSEGFGVLAPRGWYCFGTYGSGGDHINVSSEPINNKAVFEGGWKGGFAVELHHRFGGTSGRFSVAEVIAHVFPAFRAFAINVMREIEPDRLSFGPYPNDVLTYKGDTAVEYTTPPRTEGLGTYGALNENDDPIRGVAILVQTPEGVPDLIHLAVRLPTDMAELASIIVHQVEREAERIPQPKPTP